MTAEDLTIRAAQERQPWTVPYSGGVLSAQMWGVPHILASHVILHAAKSVGKLAAIFERLDHTGGSLPPDDYPTVKGMAADLMTAALRLANLYGFDLASELIARTREKNGRSAIDPVG